MQSWLVILLCRFLSGERYHKATSEELRWVSAYAAIVPVFFLLFGLGIRHLENINQIWLIVMISGSVVGSWLAIRIVFRYIPVLLTWVLAVIMWIAAFLVVLVKQPF
jgi:hypothetical protein